MKNSSQPVARLLWQNENGKQELLLRIEDVVTIGRGDMNTIVVDSPRVSRNHARIEYNGDSFSIRDLSSSNGTFVNGQRMEYLPCELKNGDLIFLERFPIRFEIIHEVQKEADAFALPTVPLAGRTREVLKPRLVVIAGPETGREIVVGDNGMTIGRVSQSTAWEVHLNDRAVSRPHARLERNAMNYILIDLGSANGTTVNERLIIAPIILNDGDIISMGDTKLIFSLK
jgi:pSer/pThr/pTyr-binding forkhead associated (FHA) protein